MERQTDLPGVGPTGFFRLKNLKIRGLWGRRDLDIPFFPDVSVIIGRNASGKTTIINSLRHLLTADISSLQELEFSELVLSLESKRDGADAAIAARRSDGVLTYSVLGRSLTVPGEVYYSEAGLRSEPGLRRRERLRAVSSREYREIRELLRRSVPGVWLPVSRRLPIAAEDEDEKYYVETLSRGAYRRELLESVDQRLRELLAELAQYRLRLDAALAEKYKEFERSALELFLLSREELSSSTPYFSKLTTPTEAERDLLLSSFSAAGLLDERIRHRIDEHFELAREAIERMARPGPRAKSAQSKEPESPGLLDVVAIMLLPRTRRMIEAARSLEVAREALFEPLRKFERLLGEFFVDKRTRVADDGGLAVTIGSGAAESVLPPDRLSSGEKQLLILLTQALLLESRTSLYVADEPELSLHVTWQEKLLSSIRELAKELQIIVATHSPDIVGPFRDRVVDLARFGDVTD